MSRIFVTGAGGYIGRAVTQTLIEAGHVVQGGIRQPAALPAGVLPVITGDLAEAKLNLAGFDAVVHAAGLGHRRYAAPGVWRRANVEAAVNVARQARAAGVPRFVLISTAHVQGRVSAGVVADHTAPAPMGEYAITKLQAERAVAAIFSAGLTILRPVAVIGPQCPGNLQLLMKLLHRGIPLPLGAIKNRRSFIEVGDLARLVHAVLASQSPPDSVLAASPETIATPDLVRALAAGIGVRARLLKLSPGLLAAAASLIGQAAMWQSVAGNFCASPQAALSLGWSPRATLQDHLIETGRYYVVS